MYTIGISKTGSFVYFLGPNVLAVSYYKDDILNIYHNTRIYYSEYISLMKDESLVIDNVNNN